MPPVTHPRSGSAIALALCGAVLIVGATIRLGDIPSRYTAARLWQKDPASTSADYLGVACLGLAAWLARTEKSLDDTNDPADDPLARLEESGPDPRPAAPTKHDDP